MGVGNQELLCKVESMLQESRWLHISLYVSKRTEEKWSCRDQQLRARLEADLNVGITQRKQKTADKKLEVESEHKQ